MRVRMSGILLSALVLCLGSVTVWAFQAGQAQSEEPPGPPRMGMRGMMGGEPGEELGLSDEQQQQLHALMSEARKSGLRARTDIQLKEMELEELMEAEEPNEAAIEQNLRGLSDLRQAALRQRIGHRLAFRRLLTAEQRHKLDRWRHHRRFFVRRHLRQRWMERPGRNGPRNRGLGFGRDRGDDFGLGPDFDLGPADDFEPDFGPEPMEPPR